MTRLRDMHETVALGRPLLLCCLLGLAAVSTMLAAGEFRTVKDPEWAALVHADKTPEWVKEDLPEWVLPYVGKFGLSEAWQQRVKSVLGGGVAGIDRWQANHFIVYRKETAEYLYGAYTPPEAGYKKGTLPAYEKLAAKYTEGLTSDSEKAVALLTKALPREFMHPTVPPLGPGCRANRNLEDGPLLQSGTGFCNEQARVFVRLCQVLGIRARIVYLFYSDNRTGHTIAEFCSDGRWAMADVSWFCVFPAEDGHLMSAAECHEAGPNREPVGRTYFARMQEIIALPDEALVGKRYAHIEDEAERAKQIAARAIAVREGLAKKTAKFLGDHLGEFGLINYPLPH